jgi:hypothetical protein
VLLTDTTRTRVIPHFQAGYDVDIWHGEGAHGGADPLMVQDIFVGAPSDKYLRAADYRAGAWSILTGIAANRSLEVGRPVRLDELIENLPDPDYPPMPTPDDPFNRYII